MTGHNGSDPAARLEAALERIARAASTPPKTALPDEGGESTPSTRHGDEIAARLDGLIADLRAILGPETPYRDAL
jgi:hypothetical protein